MNIVKNKSFYWLVLALLTLPSLEFLPIGSESVALSIGFMVVGFVSFLAVIFVFWVSFYAHGKSFALIGAAVYLFLSFMSGFFYLAAIALVVGYWLYFRGPIAGLSGQT
ncbi:hypothetical protein ACJJH9_14000 [Microbulbifer sp. DLAB2-AF]|uniref:hypothetical protein n=1 Tax=Microbulbifer sp. DLAB2-AF TaxID=3243395 RepID=UPI00403A2F01